MSSTTFRTPSLGVARNLSARFGIAHNLDYKLELPSKWTGPNVS